jgi:selenide,water dikinase
MRDLPVTSHPNLLVGIGTSDDAGVYKLNDELALVQTLDFLTPIVDDPYDFGRIAAANSLSDVYAMGGQPLTVMNIVCFPVTTMPKDILKDILRGGLEKIAEAGAVLVGGHSVDDQELKYGLSVTGTVHPDRVLANVGAEVGDRLILTKPIGTGVVATAIKGRLASRHALEVLVDVTSTLNRRAAEVASAYDVHACTDVTGFGLGGHLLEMARGSHLEMVIHTSEVPMIAEAKEYGSMGLIPAGSYATRHFCEHSVEIRPGIETLLLDLVFDPQTSGGLILAMTPDQARACVEDLRRAGVESAAVIGEVVGPHPKGRLRID